MATSAPLFIIGGSRTGSEMLRDLLTNGSDYALLPEAHLITPPWLHRDFVRSLRKRLGGRLPRADDVETVVEFMYSDQPFGAFWQGALRRRRVIEPEAMRAALATTDCSPAAILEVSMRLYAEHFGKARCGAKFPVHFSRAQTLTEWFPGCRLLHTIRDPRASLASQLRKRAAKGSALRKAGLTLAHVAHINLQFRWQVALHRRLAGREDYRLVRYEDVTADPERELRAVCEFLDMDFREALLTPRLNNTSFDGRRFGQAGEIGKEATERWRTTLPAALQRTVSILQRTALAQLGYPDT